MQHGVAHEDTLSTPRRVAAPPKEEHCRAHVSFSSLRCTSSIHFMPLHFIPYFPLADLRRSFLERHHVHRHRLLHHLLLCTAGVRPLP